MSGLARSVIPLLSEWEKFTWENPDGDLTGFAQWILFNNPPPGALSAQPSTAAIPGKSSFLLRGTSSQPPAPSPAASPADTTQGAVLIARLHRILRVLSKPILKDLGFTKDAEFAALVQVAIMDKPNKKQLCRELLLENSTGVEITKRLAKKGVIIESPDPKDRRSALLTVTPKGVKLLRQGYDRLSAIHGAFLDALTPDEQDRLIALLARVNQFQSHQIAAKPDLLE